MIYDNEYESSGLISEESVKAILLKIKQDLKLSEKSKVFFNNKQVVIKNTKSKIIFKGDISFDLETKEPKIVTNFIEYSGIQNLIIKAKEKAIERISPFYEGYRSIEIRDSYKFEYYSDRSRFYMYLFLYKTFELFEFNIEDLKKSDKFVYFLCHKLFSDKMVDNVDSVDSLYKNLDSFLDLKAIVEFK